MPYSDEEAAKETYEELSKKDLKHKRMSYFTALNLSFNNLLTKKGRTLLTAFAGSIGIIGIALILSLSDGFRNYIKSVEEDTLSTYPLEITDESIDMSAMMGIMLGTEMKSEEEHDMDKVYSNNFVGNYMKNMLGEVKVNDMVSFKDYIEEGDGQKMKDYTSDIMYTYGITINAYKSDVEKEVYQVNPSTVFDSIGFGSMSEMDNLGMTALIGMFRSTVTPIPIKPATKPMIIVSALNTREISFFDAPMLRSTPISFVRSNTEIYVMIPIMIELTTSEIATNAISTYEIALIIVLMEDIIVPTISV